MLIDFIAPYSLLITVLFMSFSYLVYLHDSIIYDHMIYARAPSLYSYTLIESFGSLDLHVQVYGCYILPIRYLQRITKIMRSLEFSLFDYWYSYSLLFCHFLDSWYIGLLDCSIPLFICYHVWSFICYIAVLSCHHSDLYSLFRLL